MKELRDRVAVVTGAASGIGLAMAERFAAEGMKVVLADVEPGALQRAESRLQSAGARTLAVPTDVTKPDDVAALAKQALAAFGAVHVVCNNAGVTGSGGLLWEGSLQDWQWVVGVNFWGVLHGIRTFVPIMLEQGDEGHIVNTASMAGHIAVPLLSPYHATKFAVVSISEILHHELTMTGAKVKASVLCPGFVHTNIMSSERNRPPELSTEVVPQSEFVQALRSSFGMLVESGMPPANVAAEVLRAIREERFWIFPHPEMLALVRERMESIVNQRNPSPLPVVGPTQ